MNEYIRELIAEEQGVDLSEDYSEVCPQCGGGYFGRCDCGYEDEGFEEWCKKMYDE